MTAGWPRPRPSSRSAACWNRLKWPGGVEFLVTGASGMMSGAIIDFDQSVLGCYEAAPQPRAAMSLTEGR